MRILTPEFLEAVPPTLNVHPSLLPAFPGDDAHEQVLDAGVRVTGCTVHVVTAAVDDGPIVTQEAVPVYGDDDADSLKRRVLHDAEFAAYPRAVRWFSEGRLRIDGGVDATDMSVTVEGDDAGDRPERRVVSGDKVSELRYGENPHQPAAVYADAGSGATGVVRGCEGAVVQQLQRRRRRARPHPGVRRPRGGGHQTHQPRRVCDRRYLGRRLRRRFGHRRDERVRRDRRAQPCL